MNGDLQVESTQGLGSTFSLQMLVECAPDAAKPATVKGLADLPALPGTRVLVVEDNTVNMLVATRVLKGWGMTITTAENGQEALERLAKESFDIVLIDLEMPVMDGATAVKEIRKTLPHLPILAFTAAAYENMQADLQAKGMNGYVQKPFRPQELHEKISSLLPAHA